MANVLQWTNRTASMGMSPRSSPVAGTKKAAGWCGWGGEAAFGQRWEARWAQPNHHSVLLGFWAVPAIRSLPEGDRSPDWHLGGACEDLKVQMEIWSSAGAWPAMAFLSLDGEERCSRPRVQLSAVRETGTGERAASAGACREALGVPRARLLKRRSEGKVG